MMINETLQQSMTQEVAFDGRPAQLVTLENPNGMQVSFMDIGATWLSCLVPVQSERREVLLGVATMPQFIQQEAYLGATIGRYANRIHLGKFTCDNQDYQVATNQFNNCLHGGAEGFDRRRWHIDSQTSQKVVFSLVSEDGDQGFPGTLTVCVSYTLTDDNAIVIEYDADIDKACPVNLTNHGYFNLQGAEKGGDCLEHHLSVAADYFLPTDSRGIPSGELKAVIGTGFDFGSSKVIGQDFMLDEEQKLAAGYDHAFLLVDSCRNAQQAAATVVSPDRQLMLEVFTTKPAIQLYTGNFLAGCPNREGAEYSNCSGFSLEAQYLPDSPNQPDWQQESCMLTPDQHYRHKTIYHFMSVGK